MYRKIISIIFVALFYVSCSEADILDDVDLNAESPQRMKKPSRVLKDPSTINILIFGNSFSRDAFSYMPFVIESCTEGISINVDILQIGGVSLKTHYNRILEHKAGFILDRYTTEAKKWTFTDSIMADSVVLARDWDMVIFQEGRGNARDYSLMSLYCGNIKDYILQYNSTTAFAFMTNPSFFDAPSLVDSNSDYYLLAQNSQRIRSEGIVDYTIPCGTAIQRARHTFLDSIGDYGHFSYEGRHLQEGLPCLIEAYTAAQTIMDIFGIEGSINGNPLRVTQAWAISKGIPGRHGVVIEGSEWDYFVCQQCALFASQHPFVYDNVDVRMKYPYLFPLYGFNLEAHRGFSAEYPENTLLAFREAGKIPEFRGIETDVQMTKDGVLVCIHDRTLDRTTTGTGNVKDYTYSELMNMDINGGLGWNDKYAGQLKIPTFENYLNVCSLYHKIPYVELKSLSRDGIKKTIDMIYSKGFKDGEFVLISFTKSYLTYAASLCRTPLELMKNEFEDADLDELARMDNFVVRPTCKFLTEDFVKKCEDRGLLLECYSVISKSFGDLIRWGVAGGTVDTWKNFDQENAASIAEVR